jgi:hypothetical protein
VICHTSSLGPFVCYAGNEALVSPSLGEIKKLGNIDSRPSPRSSGPPRARRSSFARRPKSRGCPSPPQDSWSPPESSSSLRMHGRRSRRWRRSTWCHCHKTGFLRHWSKRNISYRVWLLQVFMWNIKTVKLLSLNTCGRGRLSTVCIFIE